MSTLTLPTEIWRVILRLATANYSHKNDFRYPKVVRGRRASFQSMRTKQNFVLVSSYWRAIAVELLYETLSIRSSRQLHILAAALEDSQQKSATSISAIFGHGWWTRHVDIGFMRVGDAEHSTLVARALQKVLQYCPNLSTFTDIGIPISRALPTDVGVIHALREFSCSSLISVEWDSSVVSPGDEVMELLRASPRLQTLSLGAITKPNTPESISLPELKSLKITSTFGHSWTESWDLPALTHVEIINAPCSGFPDASIPFFSTHGPKLTSLVVFSANYGITHLAPFLQLCPNLRELTFELSICFNIELDTPHASTQVVRILGLNDRQQGVDELPTIWWNNLDVVFEVLLGSSFPSLAAVQVADLTVKCAATWWLTVLPQRRLGWWNQWVKRFDEQGVRFEDAEGGLLAKVLK